VYSHNGCTRESGYVSKTACQHDPPPPQNSGGLNCSFSWMVWFLPSREDDLFGTRSSTEETTSKCIQKGVSWVFDES
jgi:hypothetical protein